MSRKKNKVYPQKQEIKPIDKKAFMKTKKNCLTNLWFIRNEKLMRRLGKNKKIKFSFREWFIDRCKESINGIVEDIIRWVIEFILLYILLQLL